MDHATVRRARLAVTLLFLTNGMAWSNIVPRYPEIRDNLGLSYGAFGVAVAAGALGALALGLAAAPLVRRFTSARVALASMVAMSVLAVVVGIAPSGVLLALSFFALGAIDSVADVAQNAHGLRVQRAHGKSLLNGFHAMWSVGAVIGGLMGAAATGLHIPVPVHLIISGALIIGANVVANRMVLRGPDRVQEDAGADAVEVKRGFRHVPARSWALLLAFGLIAIFGVWTEDAGFTWAASFLRDELGAGPSLAAMGFVALMLFHFIGRVTGDRLIDRFGQRAVVRTGGLITAAGMGLALLFPSIPVVILGFALAGLGAATTVPVAMHAADELPGFKPTTALTLASWMLRIGFLAAPPLVGALGDAFSLRIGLLVVVFAGVAIMVLATWLNGRQAPELEPATASAAKSGE